MDVSRGVRGSRETVDGMGENGSRIKGSKKALHIRSGRARSRTCLTSATVRAVRRHADPISSLSPSTNHEN